MYALNRLVTQNVDALHHKAQSHHLTELHGSAHRVICLSCHHKILRCTMQEQIKALNPEWHAQSLVMAPDGDVSLTPQQVQGFKVMASQTHHCPVQEQISNIFDVVKGMRESLKSGVTGGGG